MRFYIIDATTPPSNRPESPTSLHNNRSLSPGSPTVRQTPLVNVFETSLTEEDITAQQGTYKSVVLLLLFALNKI